MKQEMLIKKKKENLNTSQTKLYSYEYTSPIGPMIVVVDSGGYLVYLNFGSGINKSKEYSTTIEDPYLFNHSKLWLNRYFDNRKPNASDIPIRFINPTPFRELVWNTICDIPHGETRTYGDIAKIIGDKMGIKKMSAQAVGGALSKNPIPIIVPCHRIVGADNSLTGFSVGIEHKVSLLKHEGIDVTKYIIP